MKLVYFAWIRERIGTSSEEIELPPEVETIGELIAYLAGRGENYAEALKVPEIIRAAINQEHVEHAEKIGDAREIALFPPVTGG
ncbi:molybdopterin converting factor subunit 1 [Pseudohoeflea coraliihabitans]|uniref:Molybdopterin synthase sulfur carrier subunit n=1 Tax=Pseudohoeflea coraliihabitans TaxID=2860393 RepID=A0ABS6WTI1_9HYPH|nr:molybdopterin converting factor subunit 1 [Pseudohoeflea sp. DP4N28-3]MBW3098727.1 molybdopterin converting factor subunit 1 [Pseudohoeflea sp. DP4N28-3]